MYKPQVACPCRCVPRCLSLPVCSERRLMRWSCGSTLHSPSRGNGRGELKSGYCAQPQKNQVRSSRRRIQSKAVKSAMLPNPIAGAKMVVPFVRRLARPGCVLRSRVAALFLSKLKQLALAIWTFRNDSVFLNDYVGSRASRSSLPCTLGSNCISIARDSFPTNLPVRRLPDIGLHVATKK